MVSLVFSSDRPDFGFKIAFARNTEDPDRVFRAFSSLISFCNITDQFLIKSLEIPIEHTLLLDNIEQGSIIVWLKNLLQSPGDEINPEIVSLIRNYLVNSKAAIFKFVNERDTIKSNSELSGLKSRIESLAKETQANGLGIYQSLHERDLLESLCKFQAASSELKASDKLYYLTEKSTTSINRNFSFSEETKESLLVKETIETESCLILKVKRPDYLGDSKWQFKHGNRIIEAKLSDLEWLKSFRQRKVFISPGDAIKAKVKTIEKYDYRGDLILTQFILQEVLEVIPMPVGNQLSLFDESS